MADETAGQTAVEQEFYMPTLEDLFKVHTDDKLTEERAKFGTILTGTYDLKVEAGTTELRPSPSDKEYAAKPDTTPEQKARTRRPRAHLSASLSQEGVSKGKLFFDISWEVVRGLTNRMDTKSGLYEDFKKHIVPEGKKFSVAEILKAIPNYTWKAKISELWKLASLPDGHKDLLKTATTQEQRDAYAKEGREPFNSVNRVWLPKKTG